MLQLLSRSAVCALLFAVPFIVQAGAGLQSPSPLTVNEAKSRMEFVGHDLHLTLVVDNASDKKQSGQVRLEFLDPASKTVHYDNKEFEAAPGTNSLLFQERDFLGPTFDQTNTRPFRLKYSVSAGPGREKQGFVGFSRLLPPEQFHLKANTNAGKLKQGLWPVSVFALEPGTLRPVAGVTIKGKVTTTQKGGSRSQELSGRTGALGNVDVNFTLPKLEKAEVLFEVTGQLGNEVHRVSESFSTYRRSYGYSDLDLGERSGVIHVTTDKPIYQPGQTMRIRTLAFGLDGKALTGRTVALAIKEPSSAVSSRKLVTSRFGEADTSWPLPEKAGTGTYAITASIEGFNIDSTTEVEVSRYDLPTFLVGARPDRGFYKSGDTATVTIDTRYLFGQPLPQAHVRIAKTESRFRATTFSNADVVAEGNTDAAGRFIAKIKIDASPGSDSYLDLDYKVSATDPLNGRTEYRLFGLRVTEQPIHVYFSAAQPVAPGLPLDLFVQTSYADGSPAECQVSIFEELPEQWSPWTQRLTEVKGSLLRAVSTNRFGVARLSGLKWSPNGNDDPSLLRFSILRGALDPGFSVQPVTQRPTALSLAVEATDARGAKGQETGTIHFDRVALQIYSDKTIYASGELLHVRLLSTERTGPVVVDIRDDKRILETQVGYLIDGSASFDFPSTAKLKGNVYIMAFYAGGTYGGPTGIRAVSFPSSAPHLEIQSDRDQYTPGSEANLRFRFRPRNSETNSDNEALLGIRIVDRAVFERASGNGAPAPARQDLQELVGAIIERTDRTKPIPDDLSMAAEYLLKTPSGWWTSRNLHSEEVEEQPFRNWTKPLSDVLSTRHRKDGAHPVNETTLHALLEESSAGTRVLLDPWEQPLQFTFFAEGASDWMTADSGGPDKKFGTADDVQLLRMNWEYSQQFSSKMQKALWRALQPPGAQVRDLASLRKALLDIGEDIDTWKDPWGHPFRYVFSNGSYGSFTVRVIGAGNDGRFDDDGKTPTDDLNLFSAGQDYRPHVRLNLQQAVNRYFRETGRFPENSAQFEEAMRVGSAPTADLVDPWGHAYYVSGVQQRFQPYAILSEASFSEVQWLARWPPLTMTTTATLTLRSAGPNGIEKDGDDFQVAVLARSLAEEAAQETSRTSSMSGTGSLQGFVMTTAANGVPDATVTLIALDGSRKTTRSDRYGAYLFLDVPAGLYNVVSEVDRRGQNIVRDVPIGPWATTLNLILTQGDFTSIEGLPLYGNDPLTLITSLPGYRATPRLGELTQSGGLFLEVADPFQAGRSQDTPHAPAQMAPTARSFTPRLRNNFQETLLWEPALVTDRKGEAQIRFKMPDNLTTWEVEVIASTVDGQIAIASKQLLSYQPFFVEHDPPRLLTEGDQISLPVTLRSYLDRDQTLKLSMKPESWLQLLDAPERDSAVKAGESRNETFRFKAISAILNGAQRVTAVGTAASDAIERQVTVRPNGQELSQTTAQLFRGQSTFNLNILEGTSLKAARAELRLYPDVTSQVIEAVEGIFKRPAGCAEQTISSSYPSLMILRLAKQGDPRAEKLSATARQYLDTGYQRLAAYQSQTGGFSYWGDNDLDIAVTAYAIQFLHDADEFIEVDPGISARAKAWLSKQQRADGSWIPSKYAEASDAPVRALALTGYVTRSLTAAGDPATAALRYLEAQVAQSDDPYALATLVIAAESEGKHDLAARTAARLHLSAQVEGGSAFWESKTPTPFYGWGLPGRIEATALVVRALREARGSEQNAEADALIDRGLLYLLQNRDRFGVWHSTQATVLVLDAMLRNINVGHVGPAVAQKDSRVEVFVNGAAAGSAAWSPTGGVVSLSIAKFLRNGANRVEVRSARTDVTATIQLLESHYAPWPEKVPENSNGLRFKVQFDKTDVAAGETVTCTVAAQRMDTRGGGMLIAEVGLPPGATIDRESLDLAIRTTDVGLRRYEIQTDRVVLYLWPYYQKGSDFQFKLNVRYGIDALTPSSTLYDYYNEEAKVVALPTRFIVR